MSKSNEMTRFGEKLRTLRNKQGLTLRQLGEMVGVSFTFLGKLEKGEKTPNVSMVLRLANVFDVSTDQLIRDELEVD
jgi:transcriptional regulator with XRE-family HTH domain